MGHVISRWTLLMCVVGLVSALGGRPGMVRAQVAPSIEASVASGPAGTVMSVRGFAFAPRSTGVVRWDTGAVIGAYTSNTKGRFRVNITVPMSPAGPHVVSAADVAGTPLASTTFTVIGPVVAPTSTVPLAVPTATLVPLTAAILPTVPPAPTATAVILPTVPPAPTATAVILPTVTFPPTATATATATRVATATATATRAATATATATRAATATATATAGATVVAKTVPAACGGTGLRLVPVSTATQLATALANARPGDVIAMANGVYTGQFVAKVSGTAAAPIVLCGSREAVLTTGSSGSGYGFSLRANGWVLAGFTVRDALKGIMLDGASGNLLRGLSVHHTGHEAVHFRTGSSDNVIRDSEIHDTGLVVAKYGEGVYVGTAQSNWCSVSGCGPDRSDRNQIIGNRFWATTAENVDLKEGTTAGVVSGNTFSGAGMVAADSWVDAKGNGYLIANNSGTTSPLDGFQTHVILAGWGEGNVFAGNFITVDSNGYGVRIHQPSTSRNVVRCDNQVVAAGMGLANVACV